MDTTFATPSPALDQARSLSDEALLGRVRDLVHRAAVLTAELLVHLGEVDARGLFLGEGYPSMFAYCTGALGLSESATYKRLQAARLGRRLPAVVEAVGAGRIHLAGLCVLAPHLDETNHCDLLVQAQGRSKREIEALALRLRPAPPPAALPASEPAPGQVELDLFALSRLREPDASDSSVQPPVSPPRAAPTPSPSMPSPSTARPLPAPVPSRIPERRLSLVATPRLLERLERAQALLGHVCPRADASAVVERALDLLVTALEKKRFGVGARPRPTRSAPEAASEPGAQTRAARSPAQRRRAVPAHVRRAIYQRDGGRCTFIGVTGHRCGETKSLQLHHRTAWAAGGPDSEDNVTLHCRQHNAFQARRDFGDDLIANRINGRAREKA